MKRNQTKTKQKSKVSRRERAKSDHVDPSWTRETGKEVRKQKEIEIKNKTINKPKTL